MQPRSLSRRSSRFGILALAAALATATLTPVDAYAGGPRRLTAALDALKNAQKQLEEAKEPPAALHEKSLAVVRKAVEAVEKEIKAYNDQEAAAKSKAAEPKVDPKADPKASKSKAAPAAKETAEKKPAAKPAPTPKAAEEAVD